MKHSLKKPSTAKAELTIELDAAELAAFKKAALKRLAAEVKLSGFRQGKVPLGLAAKHIDPGLLRQQILEDAINWSFGKAAERTGLTPLDQPKIDVQKYDDDGLTFTAGMEIMPPVKLGDYKNLSVKMPPSQVSDEEIDQVIERLRLGRAVKIAVKRPAKQADEVWIDFAGYDSDGQPVEGASGQDYPLVLGSKTFIDGFEDALLGKRAGDEFEANLKFPPDYHYQPLRGKKITFKITVKTVKRVDLPKIDKDFASAVSGDDSTVKALRNGIMAELRQQKRRQAREDYQEMLVERLVGASQVPLPDILLNDQLQELEQEAVNGLRSRGQTLEQYFKQRGLDHDSWKDRELLPLARRQVAAGLALTELAKAENIQVTRQELEKAHAATLEAAASPAIKRYLDSPAARRDLANRLMRQKTLQKLEELNRPS
ncbi:MAG: trigger factor [Candidatus Chaera renei]|uniref:Trigger factor n=1 Tax=Candidatus Chaera renei TaxID=2506947 RepID=A0A4Q0AHT1_9BACT|nr:MAG: trigger factor [Candidatus Chaera renei]